MRRWRAFDDRKNHFTLQNPRKNRRRQAVQENISDIWMIENFDPEVGAKHSWQNPSIQYSSRARNASPLLKFIVFILILLPFSRTFPLHNLKIYKSIRLLQV